MAQRERRLIVNADDFGRSHSINAAVLQAHRNGILTSATLMVNEPACDEAVSLARENPKLGVGLHLALVCGQSALSEIPALADKQKRFSNNPAAAGMKLFFLPAARRQMEQELTAQFERFAATGLALDHVNGHLNIHLHPVVLNFILKNARRYHIRHVRLTSDPLRLNLRLARGRMVYRVSHAFIFSALSVWAKRKLKRANIAFTEHVFGLLQNAEVDETFLLKLLPELPEGDSELYSHPSLDTFKHELDALISLRVRETAQKLNVQLIRYRDLS